MAGTVAVKRGLAQMLKGGVIMDVVDVAQARIAEVGDGSDFSFTNGPRSPCPWMCAVLC